MAPRHSPAELEADRFATAFVAGRDASGIVTRGSANSPVHRYTASTEIGPETIDLYFASERITLDVRLQGEKSTSVVIDKQILPWVKLGTADLKFDKDWKLLSGAVEAGVSVDENSPLRGAKFLVGEDGKISVMSPSLIVAPALSTSGPVELTIDPSGFAAKGSFSAADVNLGSQVALDAGSIAFDIRRDNTCRVEGTITGNHATLGTLSLKASGGNGSVSDGLELSFAGPYQTNREIVIGREAGLHVGVAAGTRIEVAVSPKGQLQLGGEVEVQIAMGAEAIGRGRLIVDNMCDPGAGGKDTELEGVGGRIEFEASKDFQFSSGGASSLVLKSGSTLAAVVGDRRLQQIELSSAEVHWQSAEGAVVGSATGTIDCLSETPSLTGTLTGRLDAALALRKGPNGGLTLEPGGQVNLNFASNKLVGGEFSVPVSATLPRPRGEELRLSGLATGGLQPDSEGVLLTSASVSLELGSEVSFPIMDRGEVTLVSGSKIAGKVVDSKLESLSAEGVAVSIRIGGNSFQGAINELRYDAVSGFTFDVGVTLESDIDLEHGSLKAAITAGSSAKVIIRDNAFEQVELEGAGISVCRGELDFKGTVSSGRYDANGFTIADAQLTLQKPVTLPGKHAVMIGKGSASISIDRGALTRTELTGLELSVELDKGRSIRGGTSGQAVLDEEGISGEFVLALGDTEAGSEASSDGAGGLTLESGSATVKLAKSRVEEVRLEELEILLETASFGVRCRVEAGLSFAERELDFAATDRRLTKNAAIGGTTGLLLQQEGTVLERVEVKRGQLEPSKSTAIATPPDARRQTCRRELRPRGGQAERNGVAVFARELTLGNGPGFRVATGAAGLGATVLDSRLQSIGGDLTMVAFDKDMNDMAELTLSDASISLDSGVPTLEGGNATVRLQEDVNVLGGAAVLRAGSGGTARLEGNALRAYEVNEVELTVPRLGATGTVETLSYNGSEADPTKAFSFASAAMPELTVGERFRGL